MIMVDELRRWPHAKPPFQRGSCHLTTDATLDELHAFAAKLGMRREWFQAHRVPHYDLTAARRREALALGAVLVSGKKQARARLARRFEAAP